MTAEDWRPIRTFKKPSRLESYRALYLVSDGQRVEPVRYDLDNRRHPWRCITNPDYDGSPTDLWFKPTHWMPFPEPPRS